jgi:hypothetical protein
MWLQIMALVINLLRFLFDVYKWWKNRRRG